VAFSRLSLRADTADVCAFTGDCSVDAPLALSVAETSPPMLLPVGNVSLDTAVRRYTDR
jgi:hypothetical protein